MIALIIVTPGAAPAQSQLVTSQDLNAGLRRWVDDGFPSLSVAIATKCGVAWSGAAGEADLVTHRPASTSDLYGIGSITKTFVDVVLLQLAEEGKVRLDQTPADILGHAAVRGVANADAASLLQLMNHTSGIPSWEDVPRWIREARGDAFDPKRHWSQKDDLVYVRGVKAAGVPGAAYSYSATNYTLLGLIIEKVTGQSLGGEIRHRILRPLGLRATYLEGFEPEPTGRLPHRYHFATAEFKRTAGVSKLFPEVRPGIIDVSASSLAPEWAAGGIVTTASDLARFALALRDGQLLKPGSFKIMTDWIPSGPGQEVGRGLFRVARGGDLHTIGHTGAVLGFGADLGWVENGDAIMVALSNVGSIHGGSPPIKHDGAKAFPFLAFRFAAQHSGSECQSPR